ncbi:MAG TPA: hypothetical protein PLJ21_07890, partial [Pseudobdellovibrionaceae bacterium]|nr:hypothetical protein [Pseudobdellovibrionaceae bacterium]
MKFLPFQMLIFLNMIALNLTFLNVSFAETNPGWGELNNSPLRYKKNYMEHSVLIEITPKGKRNVQNNLGQILGTLGVNPEEGRYGEALNTFNEPLHLEEKLTPETFKIYNQVRKFFNDYFLLNINTPRPQIRIGPSAHSAQFKKISISIPNATSFPSVPQDELQLHLELELDNLSWMTSSILVTDLNNIGFNISFLSAGQKTEQEKLNRLCLELNPSANPNHCGIIEFKDVSLELKKNGENLKVVVPLSVSQLQNGRLKFKTLSIKHNIKNLKIHRNYSGFNFFIDEIQVGNITRQFQKNKLKEVFNTYEETLITYFKQALVQFLEHDLAAQLDKKYEDFISNHSETISERSPPGRQEFGCKSPSIEQIQLCKQAITLFSNQDPKNLSRQYRFCLSADFHDVQMTVSLLKNKQQNYCPGFICPNYIEGLKISKLNFGSSVLMDVDSFIEDPLFQDEAVLDKMKMNPAHRASKFISPELKGLNKENYDLALAVNRGFFNRLLQLSWNRGYLKEIKGLDSNLKLIEPPVVDTTKLAPYRGTNPLETPFRIQLKIDYKIKNSKKENRNWSDEEEREYQSFKDYIKEKSFKNDSFILKFDVLTKLTSRNNTIYITPFKIDPESAFFDPSQLTWIGKKLRYRILNEVRAELEKKSR